MGLSMPQHEEDDQPTSLISIQPRAWVKGNQPHSLSPPEREIRKPYVDLSTALHLCCLMLEKRKGNS